MALFGSSSNNAASNNPQEVKTAIMKQLQQEAAMNNARTLIAVCATSFLVSPAADR